MIRLYQNDCCNLFFLALQQLQNDRFSFFSVVTVKKMTAATCFSVATVTKLLL
jgi:hypothetical protein